MQRAILIALCLALAPGCLTPSEPETVPLPDGAGGGNNTTMAPVAPDVFKGTGTVVASAGPVATSQGGGEANVKTGARVLYVEWRWDDPAQDLDGALSSPSAGQTGGVDNLDHTAEGGSPGSPDSPHSLTINDPEVGLWGVSMIANGGAAQTDYEFVATVFYDVGAVPAGYTGF